MNSTTRLLGGLLLLSLMLNAFTLGFIISDKMNSPAFRPMLSGDIPARMRPDIENLSPRLQTLFEDIRKTRHEVLRQQFATIRAARLAVREELGKETYDASTLSARLSALRQAEHDAAAKAHELLLQTAGDLAPEERQLLARLIIAGPRGLRRVKR